MRTVMTLSSRMIFRAKALLTDTRSEVSTAPLASRQDNFSVKLSPPRRPFVRVAPSTLAVASTPLACKSRMRAPSVQPM